jgi:16S rRNA (guanine(966)-N(2))-methyltransferase RsmD
VSLRVEAGEAGGRRLAAPAGIRPTQGLVRAAIFDVLAGSIEDAVVLDLFAGSGALGIEALSRGAARAAFVERSQACVSILRQNLEGLGFTGRSTVVRADVPRWLRSHPEQVAEAALVLLDPPYDDPVLGLALETLDRLVSPEAVVVTEHAHRRQLPALERLQPFRSRRYGDTDVTMLRAAS